jgi:hypothetical protein
LEYQPCQSWVDNRNYGDLLFSGKFHNQNGGVAMASPFAPLVMSYSVEDFEKQTPSTITQNQHVATEDVDDKYFSLGCIDEKKFQSRHNV